jgi:hypothetical protein
MRESDMGVRKRLRVLLLAAIVAAVIVPVGFALSLETPGVRSTSLFSQTPAPLAMAISVTSPAWSQGILPQSSAPANDAAKLLLVGTVLVALAGLVRRSA